MRLPEIFLANTPAELLSAAGVSVGFLVIVWSFRTAARWKLRRADETATTVDDCLLDLLRRTKLPLLLFPALLLGARILDLPEKVLALIGSLSSLSLIAQTALWASGLVDFWLQRYRQSRIESDPSTAMTVGAFRMVAVIAVWITATVVAIDNLGFEVGPLVAGLGIGGIAIALAMQNILGDLFASLSIILDRPFMIGETIKVGDYVGTVEHIGLKTTRLRSVSGEELAFSNSDLLQSRIQNFRRMVRRRSLSRIGVVYATPAGLLESIPAILQGAVEKQEAATFDRAHFVAFGDSSLDFELAYFVETSDYRRFLDVQQSVNFEIVRQFAAMGIEMAFPTRTLYIAGNTNADPGAIHAPG